MADVELVLSEIPEPLIEGEQIIITNPTTVEFDPFQEPTINSPYDTLDEVIDSDPENIQEPEIEIPIYSEAE